MPPISKSAHIPLSQRVELYADIEVRIQAAQSFLDTTQNDNVDLTALAKSHEIQLRRLQARWQGRQSKHERAAANRKLSEDQKVAMC